LLCFPFDNTRFLNPQFELDELIRRLLLLNNHELLRHKIRFVTQKYEIFPQFVVFLSDDGILAFVRRGRLSKDFC